MLCFHLFLMWHAPSYCIFQQPLPPGQKVRLASLHPNPDQRGRRSSSLRDIFVTLKLRTVSLFEQGNLRTWNHGESASNLCRYGLNQINDRENDGFSPPAQHASLPNSIYLFDFKIKWWVSVTCLNSYHQFWEHAVQLIVPWHRQCRLHHLKGKILS